MTRFFVPLFVIFLYNIITVSSQERLQSLQVNTQKKFSEDGRSLKSKSENPLTLPFIDDFSNSRVFPDEKLWADDLVFINSGFPVNPKSTFVATFDALDNKGSIHPAADTLSFQFPADYLTSHAIRLDSVFDNLPRALEPSDSVMLSFFFQPQGNGTPPRPRDSLLLQFLKTPGYWEEDPENPENMNWVDDEWETVWRQTGSDIGDFLETTDSTFFKFVPVKITDQQYFRDDFKFRFLNYASFPANKNPQNMAGNTSIWNLDYVYLDYGRTLADSFFYDITFAAPPESILRNYQSIPWKQYIANPSAYLKGSLDNKIANLDDITYNYTYRYFIEDENGNNVRNYSGGSWNIDPYTQAGFQNYEPHANPIVVPSPLPVSPAQARQFTLYHAIREGSEGDEWTHNDTISKTLRFDNYFAYDDGTPENGYGLIGNNALGAVEFVLQVKDTLTGVKFYFNPTLNEQNLENFIIKVWKNLSPEEIIYESELVSTAFEEGVNKFTEYTFETPLEVEDTIYVGWEQTNDVFLNIGFDTSNNASDHIFYNTTGEWIPSLFEGSLMLRPVFGEQVFMNNNEFSDQLNRSHSKLIIYPNPAASDYIHIKEAQDFINKSAEYQIFDMNGRVLRTGRVDHTISVNQLPEGIYMIRINHAGELSTGRFVILR